MPTPDFTSSFRRVLFLCSGASADARVALAGHSGRVRHWTVADIDELAPAPALHRLQRLVTSLVDELAAASRSHAVALERLAI